MAPNKLLSIGECMIELRQGSGEQVVPGFAGDTFNVSYYARACMPRSWEVQYLTAVGHDVMSGKMLDFMASLGIGTRWVPRIEGRLPGLYLIHLDEGERSFSYWRSASAAKLLARDEINLREAVDECKVIYFSGITLAILSGRDCELLLAEMRRAKTEGKLVVFDPNIRPDLWEDKKYMLATISRAASVSQLVLPSFGDEQTHFGDASIDETIARYRDLGNCDVVVKNDADEIAVAFGGNRQDIAPVSGVKVIDSTGAGDSFNGAFLARYISCGDPLEATKFASRVAATVITHHGALLPREQIPTA